MSGLGNVLTGFIGGAAGGLVAIGGVQRLREKRAAVRRRKESPEAASEEPAHTGSHDGAAPGRPPADIADSSDISDFSDIAARLAEAEANLADAALALSAQQERLAAFAHRFDRVMGKAARSPAGERDEPVVVFAAFLRDIDETGFDPGGEDATPEQRAAHRAARDAADRAEHWLGRTGDKDRVRQIHAAVGEGRKALIRLDALRRGRAVPLAYLDPAELTGFVDAAAAPYTEDRFRWEGRTAAEFLLDRPRYGKPVLVEVRREGGKSTVTVVENEKTDRTMRQVQSHPMFPDDAVLHLMVRPEVTHFSVQAGVPWTVTVVDVAAIPVTGDSLSGRGPAMFRDRVGARRVTIQGTDSAAFRFYPDCKCKDLCKVTEHWSGVSLASFTGPFRQDVGLPGARGVLVVQTKPKTLWSLDLIKDR